MALQSSVGITVGVSATLPATHDAAGFAALTFTPCGKLSAAAPMTGTYDVATFDNLSTGEEEKVLDVLRAGNGDMTFAYDDEDAGQTILDTRGNSDTPSEHNVAFEFTLNNGDVYYRLAVLTSYRPEGTVGQVLTATVAAEFYRKHIKVPAV